MDDEQEREKAARNESTRDAEAPATPRRETPPRRSRLGLKLFGLLILLPALLVAAWLTVALHWSYSSGTRAGYIQKFSQKGWVCKTWEGELAMVNVPGAMQERFSFTVRDDSVAALISKSMGSHVSITYEQHKGIPGSCFGETEYYVTGVQPIAQP